MDDPKLTLTVTPDPALTARLAESEAECERLRKRNALLIAVAEAAEANYEVRHKPMTSLSDVSKRFDLLDNKAATWVALDSAVRALRAGGARD